MTVEVIFGVAGGGKRGATASEMTAVFTPTVKPGLGFRVEGLGFRVWGLGFRGQGRHGNHGLRFMELLVP